MAGPRGGAAISSGTDPPLSSGSTRPDQTRSRSTTLDDPTANDTPPPPPRGPRTPAPGLGAQIGATRDAAIALVRAHIDLAKAEAGAIAGQVGRLAALGALAIALVIFAFFLAVVGTALFAGEWLLGSIGWGVLHGVLLFLAVAVAAVLVGIGVSTRRVGGALIAAVVAGIILAFVLGLNLPNRLFTSIGDAVAPNVDPAVRPLVVGLAVGALVGLVVGIVVAATRISSGAGRVGGLVGLVILGVLLGALLSITFGPQVGTGIAIAAGYLIWIALMAFDVVRTGIDLETLKDRFYPKQTIDTSKETLEWLQKRMPPGIGS
jgi:hypothetical protein